MKKKWKKVRLNFWNPVFDKNLFFQLSRCKIQYTTPKKVDTSYTWTRGTYPHWDSISQTAYNNVFRHPKTGIYMMYYRGHDDRRFDETLYPRNDYLFRAVTGLLISKDGIYYERPEISLVLGLKSNLLLYGSLQSHNFFVMYDTNRNATCKDHTYFAKSKMEKRIYLNESSLGKQIPQMEYEQSFKAIGGTDHINGRAVMPFYSNDGINFKEPAYGREMLISTSQSAAAGFNGVVYDTQNVIIFDTIAQRYRLFVRHNPSTGVRSIQMLQSTTTCGWRTYGTGHAIKFPDSKIDKRLGFYTPSVIICPGSPDYFIFTPMSLLTRTDKTAFITFMYSFDGGETLYNDILDWLKPNLDIKDVQETTDPNQIEAGLIPVVGMPSSLDCKRLYLYALEGNCAFKGHRLCGKKKGDPSLPDTIFMTAYEIRYGGYASITTYDWNNTDTEKGESWKVGTSPNSFAITRNMIVPKLPATKEGKLHLVLNYETKDDGYILIGIGGYDKQGFATDFIKNYGIANSCKMKGNSFSTVVCWKEKDTKNAKFYSDLQMLQGRKIQLYFEMKNAKLYSFMFGTTEEEHKETMRKHGQGECTHTWEEAT